MRLMLTLLLEAKGSVDYMIPLRLSPRVSSRYRFRLVVMLAWLIHVFPHTQHSIISSTPNLIVYHGLLSPLLWSDDMYLTSLTLDVMYLRFFLTFPYHTGCMAQCGFLSCHILYLIYQVLLFLLQLHRLVIKREIIEPGTFHMPFSCAPSANLRRVRV